MKSYWIALYTEIKNMDNYKNYSNIAIPVIKKYGGIPLVRGGKSKVYSGEEFLRTVIWEFPSFDKAIECYDSPEYQEAFNILKGHAIRQHQIVEGA